MPPAPSCAIISYAPSWVPGTRVIGGQNYNLRGIARLLQLLLRTRHFDSSHHVITPGSSLAGIRLLPDRPPSGIKQSLHYRKLLIRITSLFSFPFDSRSCLPSRDQA